MINDAIKQTEGAIKGSVEKENYAESYCLKNSANKSFTPALAIKPTNIKYYNPFTQKDQLLKDVVSIEFCYQKETNLPERLVFHSRGAIKYVADQSSVNPKQTVKNPKSLVFVFNY
jgi:hypothetical protein